MTSLQRIPPGEPEPCGRVHHGYWREGFAYGHPLPISRYPAVVGLEVATSLINGGDPLIIDGETGEVVINPTEEVSPVFSRTKTPDQIDGP